MDIYLNGAGFENKGAEAMAYTAAAELGRRIPGARFHVKAPGGDAALPAGAGFLPVSGRRRAKAADLAALCRAVVRHPSLALLFLRQRRRALFLERLGRLDACVDISGFALGDAWGAGSARRCAVLFRYLKSCGRRCVFLPQAWGPFTDRGVARGAVRTIACADLAFARDRRSFEYLTSIPGIARRKIRRACDIAFLFRDAGAEAGARILAGRGIAGPIVGIVPNMRVYERSEGTERANVYIRLLADVARFVRTRLTAVPLLLPHEVRPGDGAACDDRFLCRAIQECAGGPDAAPALTDVATAAELKAIIGRCDMLVASRYHSIIAALSHRVVPVALGWSHKYAELLQDAGIAHLAFDIGRAAAADVLACVREAYERRTELGRTIDANVRGMERSAEDALDATSRVLTERE